MKWSYLNLLFGRTMSWVIIALFIIPLFADLMRTLGFDYEHLRVPIIGGIVFIVCFCFYRKYCPGLISLYKTKNKYSEWAVSENINIFEEFKMVLSKDDTYFKQVLGKNFDLFFPIEKGLSNSRKDCLRLYADIEYTLVDQSTPVLLWVIMLLSVCSIIMLNWLSIDRFCRIFGGV